MAFFSFNTIRKNLAFLVILAVLPSSAILLHSGLERRKSNIEEARHNLSLVTHALAGVQRDILNSTRQLLSSLALTPQIRSLDIQASNTLITDILVKNPDYYNIALVDLGGYVLASGLPIAEEALSGRKHFREALQTQDFAVGEYIITRTNHRTAGFAFACPVMDDEGNPVAVLTAIARLSYFHRLYDFSDMPAGSFFSLTDQKGKSIYHFPPQSDPAFADLARGSGEMDFRARVQGPKIFREMDTNGRCQIIAFEPVQLAGVSGAYMYAWAGLPEASILGPANAVLARDLVFMVLVSLMLISFAWLISRNAFLAPLKNLLNTVDQFSRGNLKHRSAQEGGPMEFQALAKAFYRMADNLEMGYTALKESEARLRLLFESAPDAIFVQVEGKFAYLNAATVQLFGASSVDDLAGSAVLGRFHPDSRTSIHERFRLVIEEQVDIPSTRSLCLRWDSSSVDVEFSAVPIKFGGMAGALVFMRDISEKIKAKKFQQLLEEQLYQAQKMESVGRLAGGVAHDYNNMLGVILGYAELALDKVPASDPLHHDLTEILNAARRSTAVTRQLLAFARKQTVDPKVLDLNRTVEGMLKMLRRLIGEDIHLSWQPGTGLWPVMLDASQLDQVLANLCVNARDAIAGTGRINIETDNVLFDKDFYLDCADFVPGEYVLLTVSDTGCGMDKATQESIFEPFFTTKPAGLGTGLGLSTVYGIVRQNKGFIDVTSEPGEGTTFHIYLPRHNGPIGQESLPDGTAIPRGNGETVLMVEDEAAILKLGQRMLDSLGYNTLAAGTPDEALRLAAAHPGKIRLLITDVVMPDFNGRELADRLLASEAEIRVLYMSGYTADVIANRGVLEAGMNFIHKPFTINDLAFKVREAIG